MSDKNQKMSRRGFLKTVAGGALGLTAAYLGISRLTTKAVPVSQTRFLMGTYATITAYSSQAQEARRAIDGAFSQLEMVDETMSLFKPTSAVYKINNNSATKVEIDSALKQVLAESLKIAAITGGSFDPTIAPVVKLWGFYDNKLHVPTEKELEETMTKVGYQGLHLNQSAGLLELKRPDMMLDLGGVAKGYGVDKAIQELKKYQLSSGLVNAGGDLRVFGTPADRESWRIGLQNPLKDDDLLTTIELITKAVTTSGNYESFFTYRGEKLPHIIDPKTGLPVKNVLSVSVLADTATKADALSTGAFCQDLPEAMKLIEGLENTEVIYIYRSEKNKSKIQIAVSTGLWQYFDLEELEHQLNSLK